MKKVLFLCSALFSGQAMADGIPTPIESRFTYKCDSRSSSPNAYKVELLVMEDEDEVVVMESGSTHMAVEKDVAENLRTKKFKALVDKPIVDAPVYRGRESYHRTLTIVKVSGSAFDFTLQDKGEKELSYKNCRAKF